MMSERDILVALQRLEHAHRPQSPERLAVYVEGIQRHRVTPGQLGDAVNTAIDRCDRFPALSELLRYARPEAVNMPRRDGEEGGVDPIVLLERDVEVQNAWLRRFAQKGDEYGQRMARLAIERASRKMNDRLEARGQGPRYVAVGVEVFGSDTAPRAKRAVSLEDSMAGWTVEEDS